MIALARAHMHHVVGGWPIIVAIGVFLVVILCAVIVLLTRRPRSATPGSGAAVRFGPYESCPGGSGSAIAGGIHEPEIWEDSGTLDARILGMLRQKGEPMSQGEIAENLGVAPDALGSWLAGMERREMLGRTWNTEQSTYVVHLRDEAEAD